ncbi:MAG: arsenate reductase [Litoreibacter sp.]|nr:arsenate reductase [Litoreibacter sp.]
MKLYGIKACDTCRKALKSLEAAGNEVEFVDVREAPLEPSELRRFAEKFGEALTNTRSTTWRGLSDAERARPQLELLTENPTLMKRPVIETDELYLGWKKDVQDALL